MFTKGIISSFALVSIFSLSAENVHAAFIDTGIEGRPTSRQVERSAEYIRSLDAKNRREGIVRRRSTEQDATTKSYDALRSPSARAIRKSTTIPAAAARSRLFYTPAINSNIKPSVLSVSPVSVETEALYRNGIKYYRGDGGERDLAYAYMWLSFALADGHPLAREALLIVARALNPVQLEEAKERTKILSTRFLSYDKNRNAVIRDRLREQDLESLLKTLRGYWWRHSQYPVPMPKQRAVEICSMDAVTCIDKIDLRSMVPEFLLRIPSDPHAEIGGNGTGYFVLEREDGSLLLFSQFSEYAFVVVIGK